MAFLLQDDIQTHISKSDFFKNDPNANGSQGKLEICMWQRYG